MLTPHRKKPGRPKRCSTKGCKSQRIEGYRFCGKCAAAVHRGMVRDGYLDPDPGDLRWFHWNGLRMVYY